MAEGKSGVVEKADKSRQWRTLGGLVSMMVGAVCLVASIPGQAGAEPGAPPGNNGTVKIDGIATDPGWAGIAAVKANQIVPLDDDIASRWGPRVVDLVRQITDAVAKVPA